MSKLENLKNTIEDMPKYHQIEVLSILKEKKNIILNENNNGTFINLSELDDDSIQLLHKYVKYVEEQKNQLDVVENEKKRIEKTYFNKDNKDNITE